MIRFFYSCLFVFLTLLIGGCATTSAPIQPTTALTDRPAMPPSPELPRLPPGRAHVLPADSVLEIALDAPIDTRTAKPKDGFPIKVARSVVADGYTVVPAGTPGFGEVVHAQKSGAFGKPAELLLAVRWIELGDQRVPMRHFRPFTGQSKESAAANMIFIPVAGLFSPFVRGGEILLPAGTLAFAQVREDTRIEGSALPTVPPQASSSSMESSEP